MNIKPQKRPVLMIWPALAYVLLFGWVPFKGLLPTGQQAEFALQLVMAFAYVWALFFTLRFLGARAFRVALVFLFITGGAAAYFIHAFHIRISIHMVAVLFEAEPVLIRQFLTLKLLAAIVLTGGFGWWLAGWCIRHEQADPKDKMVLLVSGMFVFTALFMDGGISRQYLPYNYLLATADYAREQLRPKPQLHDLAQEPAALRKDLPENLVAVLVIGESARPDHLGVLGYARQTTPFFAEEKNIRAYGDVPSCGPFTRDAVPCLMTRASYLSPEKAQTETSFIRLFDKLGFHTVWVDMQGSAASVFDTRIGEIMAESREVVSLNTQLFTAPQPDEAAAAVVERVLKEQQGRVLLVLHLFGSHWPYEGRVPEAFRKFTPTCSAETPIIGDFRTAQDMAACERQHLINAYDNSILYTDYVLHQVMERLRGRPSFLLYTSDHGESLGEDGYFLHGNVTPEGLYVPIERRVPLLFWRSEGYAARALAEEPITHDYIFHSMLDCAGLESPVVNRDLSICTQ